MTATAVDAAIGACATARGGRRTPCIRRCPVNAPLLCEIWDERIGRSIGGCRYHVAHPGGRAHTLFPVNSYEAEGRRLARFEAYGFTPGAFTPPPLDASVDFPHTLDLRRR